MIKRIVCLLTALLLLTVPFAVFAAEEDGTRVFFVDSLNGTRWADYLCVYKGIEHTGQNEWGDNVIVNSEGIVTEKIPGADIRGKNLKVPEGGFVVSGTGDIGKEMYSCAEIGDRCLFDEYSMRVYFSKNEIDPFYEKEIRVTGYNGTRWSDTVIIYDKSGTSTGTNPFGYEVCVSADGYVVSSGGNDNTVPEGGYVISATEKKDTDILKMYFTVGTRCRLNKNSVTGIYGKAELTKTAESELALLNKMLENAKKQYKLIDYAAIEAKIASIETDMIETLEERNAVIAKIRETEPLLVESRTVDTRSVWYTCEEDSAEEIRQVVAEMKEAGINELVLASNTSKGTIIPINTKEIPFKRDPVVRRLDILQTYIDECRANGISIVVLCPVMGGSFGENHEEWFDVTNTGEPRDEIFFSPANGEYRKVFMDYVRYILTNYDVDGLQLDYIRYPQFYDNVDAGYDEATVKLFEEKTGNGREVVEQIGKQLTEHPKWNVWWSFKTELINSWVKEVYELAGEVRPDIYVTAAVAASDSVGYYCQDPSAWLKDGYIDGIYVMSYTEGITEHTTEKHIVDRGDDSYLVMGCGAYLSISNKSLIEQTDNSIMLGADGTGYFEWGAVKNHRYTEIFKSSLFKTEAIPFTAEAEEVAKRLVATAKSRAELYCTLNEAANANEIRGIFERLPENGVGKEELNTAITALSELLDGEAEKILTKELYSALRALNMKKSDFDFVKPQENESSKTESETASEEISESSEPGRDESGFPIIPVAIGAVVLVAAVVFAMLRKK